MIERTLYVGDRMHELLAQLKHMPIEHHHGVTFLLGGVEVRVNPILDNLPSKLVQFRFPRSKKKRIRKKWSKRPENFREVKQDVILMMPPDIHFGMAGEILESHREGDVNVITRFNPKSCGMIIGHP